MKKILTFITTIALSFSFVACEALFDNLEGDMSKLSGDYLASSEAGLSRMMATLYASIPMGAFAEGDKYTDNASDTHSAYVNNSTPSFWSYTTMRNANVLIKTVQDAYEAGNISEDMRNIYIAEARFVRAYYYFGMVRTYGGVPIITEPLTISAIEIATTAIEHIASAGKRNFSPVVLPSRRSMGSHFSLSSKRNETARRM